MSNFRRMTVDLGALVLATIGWWVTSCRDAPFDAAPARLSSHGFFVNDLAAQLPASGVVPYEINMPLFSDSAEKLRFVRLPEGQSATYRGEGVFDFPVGTTIVKTFYYPNDRRVANGARRLIETRLLIHEPEGWVGLPYVWNEEQTEAELRITGARVPVAWIDEHGVRQRLEYRVPSVSDCSLCHRTDSRTVQPIGTKAAQLNRAVVDARGATTNQLDRWHRDGLLAGLPSPAQLPRYPNGDDETSGTLEDRARAYLDVNCAHCHNPIGPASGTQLDLRYAQRDVRRIGVFKRPVAAGRGSGDLLYDIWPGRPDASILVYRMASREPGVMMPELGRTIVDREGVELVRAWIASLR
jgi:uncharacterized repeat protein (TIGR03806 family)